MTLARSEFTTTFNHNKSQEKNYCQISMKNGASKTIMVKKKDKQSRGYHNNDLSLTCLKKHTINSRLFKEVYYYLHKYSFV